MGKKLGLKIKQLRSEYSFNTGNRVTQKDLADKLGISRSYLGDIESGRSSASDELIYKLSNFFGIDDSILFNCKSDDDNSTINVEHEDLNTQQTEEIKKERDYSLSIKEQENIGDEAKKIIEELSMSFSKDKDSLSEEDYFAVENAIRTTLEAIKIKNKKKFTPKKYR